jgi:hypothetical protein
MRDVLHCADASGGIFRPEVEWAKMNRIVGRFIHTVERDADKALLLRILAPDVDLEGALAKLDPFHVGDGVTGALGHRRSANENLNSRHDPGSQNPKANSGHGFGQCGGSVDYLIVYRPGTNPLQVPGILHGHQDVEQLLKSRHKVP